MNILVTGATGLIGSECIRVLRCAGHRVIAGVRRPSRAADEIGIDFARDTDVETWLSRLAGVDVIINAVGIIDESSDQTFDALHRLAPQALFAAAATVGVRRIIQLSALGADEHATTQFHATKKAADDFLLGLPIEATVLQPSLVFSTRGSSTRLFAQLASLPVLPIPAGESLIQPIALDDLIETIVRLVAMTDIPHRLAAAGGEALSLRAYLQLLRVRMGRRAAPVLPIPPAALQVILRVPGAGRIANTDTIAMLNRGNHANATPLAQVLGRMPATPLEFITPARAADLDRTAAMRTGTALLRVAIAAMWIVTGIVSFGIYPIDASLQLLQRTGLTGLPAHVALFGAAGLDIALGIATLCMRQRWVWSAQMLLIFAYTVIISIQLPEFWLHPYGPILKNIPLLAAIALMRGLERRPWNT